MAGERHPEFSISMKFAHEIIVLLLHMRNSLTVSMTYITERKLSYYKHRTICSVLLLYI